MKKLTAGTGTKGIAARSIIEMKFSLKGEEEDEMELKTLASCSSHFSVITRWGKIFSSLGPRQRIACRRNTRMAECALWLRSTRAKIRLVAPFCLGKSLGKA
jgi:hypothetical protein